MVRASLLKVTSIFRSESSSNNAALLIASKRNLSAASEALEINSRKKQFLADVMHEINMLKLHTTKTEKNKLDFNTFDPEKPTRCIYGQITGDCRNRRSKELIDICCIRVIDTNPNNIHAGDSFNNIKHLKR